MIAAPKVISMNCKMQCVLFSVFVCSPLVANEPVGWETLIQQTQQSGRLPADITIRVSCNMYGGETDSRFRECWEFTSDRVHKIAIQNKDSERRYRRQDSRKFESLKVAQKLTKGSVIRLSKPDHDSGEGEYVLFAFTDFEVGDRFIEVFRKGKRVCSVGETCAVSCFQKDDAEAFAKLYESLASMARESFKPSKNQLEQ